MSRKRIIIVTIGIMFSIFLASMESTVAATAMPTIVGELGGLEHYSWVFSAYMLASTTAVPLYGKLSDLYGRRLFFAIAMAFFLSGCILAGQAQTMTGLIIARALQGLGAGGIQPLSFILIGEMFSLEQRAKMQGLFSGVWGVSSIVGPLLGGILVEQLSWRWVFYINLIPGPIALALVLLAWKDTIHARGKITVDYLGASLLTASVVALLLGLIDVRAPISWALIALSIVLFTALLHVERRAAEPILPMHLFRGRLFTTANAHGLLAGWAMFGSLSFIPLFVQSVLGTSAMQAGITLTPMLLGWVVASIIGTRILLKVGFRKLSVLGTTLLVIGAALMALVNADASQISIMVYVSVMGVGMGLSIPSFLIAIQTTVERRHLGTATSTLQFSRSMGGTLGVSVMGAALSSSLAANLSASGLDPQLVAQLLDPLGPQTVVDAGVRLALANALHAVFLVASMAAFLAILAVFFLTPHMDLNERPQASVPTEDEPLIASMD
ncbi:MAG: Multidrug resistance protein 3 [Anaerolineales bacterium]|nr:Multidrug resistance protein 3 [Anaerolineales bacterium]